MKKELIAIIFGIVVIGALFFVISANIAISTPEKTVSKFYERWMNSDIDVNTLSSDALYTMESIVSSLEGTNYDPIVCSQEIPLGIEAYPISETEATAEVGVRETFETITKDIKVSLIREQALWKIDAIECGDMPKPTHVLFGEEGNIVQKEGDWILIYENPGKPAQTIMLDFSNWRCVGEEENARCVPSFENGARVVVIGKKINDTVFVDSLTEL